MTTFKNATVQLKGSSGSPAELLEYDRVKIESDVMLCHKEGNPEWEAYPSSNVYRVTGEMLTNGRANARKFPATVRTASDYDAGSSNSDKVELVREEDL